VQVRVLPGALKPQVRWPEVFAVPMMLDVLVIPSRWHRGKGDPCQFEWEIGSSEA
jgi:hypothetical protein